MRGLLCAQSTHIIIVRRSSGAPEKWIFDDLDHRDQARARHDSWSIEEMETFLPIPNGPPFKGHTPSHLSKSRIHYYIFWNTIYQTPLDGNWSESFLFLSPPWMDWYYYDGTRKIWETLKIFWRLIFPAIEFPAYYRADINIPVNAT